MKAIINVAKSVDIKTLQIDAGVRSWEDGEINGVEDIEGKMPGIKGNRWQVEIDIDTATILLWPAGITASIHYKVCDDGKYYLLDESRAIVLYIENDYVPNNMIPGEYGDYIELEIDEKGKITNWHGNPSVDEFVNFANLK